MAAASACVLFASLSIGAVRPLALHRWTHTLACLSMLLLVVAPLISRAIAHPLLSATHAPDTHARHHSYVEPMAPKAADSHHMGHGIHHAMPMVSESSDTAVFDTTPSQKSADPHAEHEMGVDCEYCLIAARMISLLVALLLAMAIWSAVFRALFGLVDRRRIRAPGTLGARGPPSALTC